MGRLTLFSLSTRRRTTKKTAVPPNLVKDNKVNKPVAWRKVVGNVTKHYQYNEIGEGEPLYTHPHKQLSDEEIIAVWDKDCVVLDEDKLVIRFARAIIKEITE